MADLASLPEVFEKVRSLVPGGYTLSERVLDPVILIERDGDNIRARLAGTRLVKGERSVFPAPSNRHAWVSDGTILRPLPRDISAILGPVLKDINPENLSFSDAIRLLRFPPEAIGTLPGPTLLQSGQSAAETQAGELKITGLRAELFPY